MNIRTLVITLTMFVSAMIQTAAGVHQWADNSALNEGYWVKVALDANYDGIYQISYSQLKSWGFTSPEKVGIYGFGGHELPEKFAIPHTDDLPEIAILHDSSHQRILFYGQGTTSWSFYNDSILFVHRNNSYSNKAYYFLHAKEESPKSLTMQESATATGLPVVTTFEEHLLYEKDNVNLAEMGRELYGESFIYTQLQRFALTSGSNPQWLGHTLLKGSASLTINFVASTSTRSSIKVDVDNTTVGTFYIEKMTARYTTAYENTFNAKLRGMNDLTDPKVSLTFSTSDTDPKIARLNYIRMQGKCPLSASDKEAYMLWRSTEANKQQVQYEIEGLTPQMQIWDVTNPLNVTEQKTSNGTFVPQQIGIREYAVVNTNHTSGFPSVSMAGIVSNQNLHGTSGANLVIVSAPGLMEQAQRLAQYRNTHDNLSVLVVTPEAIYNEYSSGTPDATAIRLFLKQMYDRQSNNALPAEAQLRYLLLLGDGTFDNRKNALSNFYLPTYMSENSLVETSSCTCDDYFGFLDDNEGGNTDNSNRYTITKDVLDIGIGRLPVHTNEEAENVISKIITYGENRNLGAWKNRLVFLGDDDKFDNSGHDSPNLHISHCDDMVNYMQEQGHHEFVYQKIYLPAYQQITSAAGTEYPDAKKELNEAMQQGALLINYAGHGAAANITHERMMTTSQAWELRMKKLPLWIFASCDVCRWDGSDTSMGEALLLNPNGGAIAVIGAARVVYASNNKVLNQGIIQHFCDRNEDGSYIRLGDMMKLAKRKVGTEYNKLNYALLGDPSMSLTYPGQQIEVDGVTYDDKVTISGRILKAGTQQTDTLFNGLLYPVVYGEEEELTADKGFWQEPAFTFASRTKKVFSGRDMIRNGKFKFSFNIPTDAGSTSNNGLVNLYACSDEGAEANGYYQDFYIASGEQSSNDTIAPEIKAIFLDSPSFKTGDKVGTTPFFYAEVHDASGFNTTGNSVGHDITLMVRSLSNTTLKPQQYILNQYFTTYTGDVTTGNVKYSLSTLEEGRYEATFRIWDSYNNPAVHTFQFEVSESEAPKVELVQAYPSPVKQGGTVTFRVMHNRPESAEEMHLQIYTQMGVKVLDKVVSSASAEVVYLSKDATSKTDVCEDLNADETSELMGCSTTSWAATVAPGVYMYRIYLKSDKGETSTTAHKLIVL